jgi:hypothetical protein
VPDAAGNIKGIALTGKAGEVLEKIKRKCSYPQCACEGHQDCPLDECPIVDQS